MPLNNFPSTTLLGDSSHIQFRKINKNDGHGVFDFLEKNRESFTGPFPVTTSSVLPGRLAAKRWVEEKINAQKERKAMICVAENTENKEILFLASVFNFDWRVPKCEIAWMLAEDQRGKGIATQSIKLLIDFLCRDCRMEKIVGRVDPVNQKSRELAMRLGFVEEGLHKNDFRDGHGKLVDVVYYGFLKPKG